MAGKCAVVGIYIQRASLANNSYVPYVSLSLCTYVGNHVNIDTHEYYIYPYSGQWKKDESYYDAYAKTHQLDYNFGHLPIIDYNTGWSRVYETIMDFYDANPCAEITCNSPENDIGCINRQLENLGIEYGIRFDRRKIYHFVALSGVTMDCITYMNPAMNIVKQTIIQKSKGKPPAFEISLRFIMASNALINHTGELVVIES